MADSPHGRAAQRAKQAVAALDVAHAATFCTDRSFSDNSESIATALARAGLLHDRDMTSMAAFDCVEARVRAALLAAAHSIECS